MRVVQDSSVSRPFAYYAKGSEFNSWIDIFIELQNFNACGFFINQYERANK